MSMKRFILLVICLFSLSFTYANEVVRVRKAVGRWEVSDDITPKQAEEKALNEAKKEALRMAGVMENVWSVFGQVTADNGTEYTVMAGDPAEKQIIVGPPFKFDGSNIAEWADVY